jgi:hypothetical protein
MVAGVIRRKFEGLFEATIFGHFNSFHAGF